jgi:hypothetical protein
MLGNATRMKYQPPLPSVFASAAVAVDGVFRFLRDFCIDQRIELPEQTFLQLIRGISVLKGIWGNE